MLIICLAVIVDAKRQSHPDLAHPGSLVRFRGLCWESEGHPGPDAQRFLREVAQKFATGTADLDHRKTRDEKILYNRFLRTWRTRISTLVAEGTARAVWSLSRRSSPPPVSGRCANLGYMGSQPQIDVRL